MSPTFPVSLSSPGPGSKNRAFIRGFHESLYIAITCKCRFFWSDFPSTDFPGTDCRAGNIFVVYSTTFPCLNRKKHCFLSNLRQACCSFFLCMVLPPVPCDISETPEWIFCNRRMDPVPCDRSVTDALIYLRHQIKQNKPPQRCGGLKNRTTTFFDRDK